MHHLLNFSAVMPVHH